MSTENQGLSLFVFDTTIRLHPRSTIWTDVTGESPQSEGCIRPHHSRCQSVFQGISTWLGGIPLSIELT